MSFSNSMNGSILLFSFLFFGLFWFLFFCLFALFIFSFFGHVACGIHYKGSSVNKSHKIPWTEEPGRLQSLGSLRVGHD